MAEKKVSTRHWPRKQTVLAIIKHLEDDLGLNVYGQNVDLEDGQCFPANSRNFDGPQVVRYRELVRKDELWEEGDE